MNAFAQYKNFMEALFEPTDTVAFMFLANGTPPVHDFVPAERAFSLDYFDILQKINESHNVYAAMNPFKAELRGATAGRTKANVAEVKRVYADADTNGEAVLAKVKNATSTPPPTVILQSSPGKFQFIWNVQGLTQHTAEPLLKAIAQEYGTDAAVAEVARVLRVPGFKNRKYIDAPEVTVVGDIEFGNYTPLDFALTTKSAETKAESAPGLPRDTAGLIPHGHIHSYLVREAGKLRHEFGLGEEAIYAALHELVHSNCAPPIDDSRIKAMAKDAATWDDGGIRLLMSADIIPDPTQPAPVVDWRPYFRSVGELEKGDIRMLIDGFMPEGSNYIGAPAGGGKTWLALSMAKALTTGKPFLGCKDFTIPAIIPCLYLIPEVGARAFRMRLEKFRIPDDPNLFLCRTISEGSTLMLNDPILRAAVAELKPVVFLDTAIRFNTSADENSAVQNKMLVDDIITLRQAGAAGVIALHHSTKSTRKEGMSLENILRGTGDTAASADCVYGLLRDEKLYDEGRGPEEFDVRCIKPRDIQKPPLPFRIAASRKAPEGTITTFKTGIASNIDEFGDFLIVSGEVQKSDLMSRIDKFLTNDPTLVLKDLMELTGAKKWQINSATKSLGWVKSKKGNVWKKGGDALEDVKVEISDREEVAF